MAPADNTILITYKGANQESVSAGPRDLIRLNPGVNKVDADKWNRIIAAAKKEKVKSKGGILYLIDNDLVFEAPAANTGTGDSDDLEKDEHGLVDVTKLNVKDGIAVVTAVADIASLNIYLTAEKGGQNRATLVKAIETQIDGLNKAAEEESNKED